MQDCMIAYIHNPEFGGPHLKTSTSFSSLTSRPLTEASMGPFHGDVTLLPGSAVADYTYFLPSLITWGKLYNSTVLHKNQR